MSETLKVFLAGHIVGMWEYSQGLRDIGVDARVVVRDKHPFSYPADIKFNFKGNKYTKVLQRFSHLPKLIHNFDIFHFVFEDSLLPYPYNFDVPILKLLRKKIVMQFVGSDIRPIGVHEMHDEESIINKRISKKKRRAMFWERYADAIISHPEYSQLLTKKYYVVPLGYDLEYWKPFKSQRIKKNKDRILVVHAPSNREIKGTKYVISAIDSLIKEGFNIDFKLIENMPNSDVREWLNASDIVVDQLLVGWHGALAVEAMALAKPVLCYMDKRWKEHPDCIYARDIPLMNTTPANIYDNLKLLLENPDLRNELGKRGREYVERVHDTRKVARQLIKIYRSL
ncbi:MAG: glycosyltransferase family 4 protein [Thermoplasmatales archaeon]|nr:glycosyltransferase family 4 protein [Thermoplasmatales archaeon]